MLLWSTAFKRLTPVGIGRYRSSAYKVHVIMITLILLCNMIQSDIEHVHTVAYTYYIPGVSLTYT